MEVKPLVKMGLSSVGNFRDREIACSTSALQDSSHYSQEALLEIEPVCVLMNLNKSPIIHNQLAHVSI